MNPSPENSANKPTNPPESLEDLHQLLEEEIECYGDLEQHLLEKRDLVISGALDPLAHLDQKLLALNKRAQQLEEKRKILLSGMNRQGQTLQQVIQGIPVERRKPLSDSRERLARVVRHVAELNRRNNDLLQLSIQWVNATVETMANLLVPEGAAYTAQGNRKSMLSAPTPGQTSEASTSSTLDRRA